MGCDPVKSQLNVKVSYGSGLVMKVTGPPLEDLQSPWLSGSESELEAKASMLKWQSCHIPKNPRTP